MVSVRCALLQPRTRLFSVPIADDKTVEDLHVAITRAKPNELGAIDPDCLQLFLAKKNDVWLTMGEAQDLRNVERLQSLQPFYFSPLRDVGLSQNDIKEEGGKIGPAQASMHVVVIVQRRPAVELDDVPASKLSTLGMMLKQFSGPVALPEQGDFLSLFKWNDGDIGTVKDIAAINSIVGFTGPSLYVHKEIICVLKNFLKVYAHNFKTGEETLQQFVLVGSPGTGKSCILALVCFYVAAKLGRTVMWHRRVRSGKKKTDCDVCVPREEGLST